MGWETAALLAASAALSAGGQMIASNEANKSAAAQAEARMQALREHQSRQRALRDENYQMLDQRLQQDYTDDAQNQNLENAVEARTENITDNMPVATTDVAIAGTSPDVVKTEIASRLKSAFANATDRAKALGKLGGYGDQWFNNNIGLLDTSRKIDTNNSFARQEAALLPSYQSLNEYQAYKPSTGLGQAMYGLGQIGASAAGAGAGKALAGK
jgi:type II secretory pathway pseudopilin PulG